MKVRNGSCLAAMALGLVVFIPWMFIACGGGSAEKSSGWNCADGVSCQDVYDIDFTVGSVVSFSVHDVSSGSVSQIALYGPGVPLDGTNLFTDDTNELRCTSGEGCDSYTAGEQYNDYIIPSTGTYRFAVTRDWGYSCDASGTYILTITSNLDFSNLGMSVDDQASLATGYECPSKIGR